MTIAYWHFNLGIMRPPFIQSLRPKHLAFFLCLSLILLGLRQAELLPTREAPGALKHLGASAHRLADARIESTFVFQKDSLLVKLNLPLQETGKLSVRKLGGKLVMEWKWDSPVSYIEQVFNINELSDGVYFVRVETEHFRSVRVLNLG